MIAFGKAFVHSLIHVCFCNGFATALTRFKYRFCNMKFLLQNVTDAKTASNIFLRSLASFEFAIKEM